MEDETFHVRPFLAPVSRDYVLQMEPDSTTSTPPPIQSSPASSETKAKKSLSDVDVCYPYPSHSPDQHSTLEIQVLKSFIEQPNVSDEDDPKHRLERRMTAKLDDLLDSGHNEKGSLSRRFSLYGENIRVYIYNNS
jgi:predicted ABC-type transport system involved in lysophospholipase L1 biosynthesis ATPase subunit